MKLKQSGYSLIELLIVVAIIGILAAMVIPNLLDAVDRAKQRASVADLRSWGTAVSAYNAEKGLFPLHPVALGGGSGGTANLIYDQLVPYAIGTLRINDHWNNLFHYYTPGAQDGYTVMSCGKDNNCFPDGSFGVTPSTWNNFNLDIILSDGIFVYAPS